MFVRTILSSDVMAVETNGTIRMRGDDGPGTPVRVNAGDGRLRIDAGGEQIGDWDIHQIGIKAIPEGFSIRAEGEEFVLRSADEVALAEEFHQAAATPRLARKVAAAHNPEIPPDPPRGEVFPEGSSHVAAIAFALGGVLVFLGGLFLRNIDPVAASRQALTSDFAGVEFWLAFVVGGLLMLALAFIMSFGNRWARLLSLLVVAGLIALFAYSLTVNEGDGGQFAAYGFIAGGVVIGVAVLFSGGLGDSD